MRVGCAAKQPQVGTPPPQLLEKSWCLPACLSEMVLILHRAGLALAAPGLGSPSLRQLARPYTIGSCRPVEKFFKKKDGSTKEPQKGLAES